MHIIRKGQAIDHRTPCYRLITEGNHFYIVEYCGALKILDKSDYEVIESREARTWE